MYSSPLHHINTFLLTVQQCITSRYHLLHHVKRFLIIQHLLILHYVEPSSSCMPADECRALNLGSNMGSSNCKHNNSEISHSICEKDLGLLVRKDLKPRQYCIAIRNNAIRIVGFKSRSVSNRTVDV